MAKKGIKNKWRVSLQWLVLVLLGYMLIRLFVDPNYVADFEAYCPFGGLQAVTNFFVHNALACSMTEVQIFLGVALMVGVFIFSKLFCSYICPIGMVTEWLASIGKKWHHFYTLQGWSDRLMRIFKYALLFVTFYFTVTAGELFCREYDPYYALVTGFGHDVYLWYALAALVITVIGSMFIRQFWCKYFCPLGALSNIFSNGIMFGAVLVIYLLLLYFGFEINWVWPLAIISILGFVLESLRMKGWLFPLFKITREEHRCTDCNLCTIACPMGIDVAHMDTVEHIDCHLCGDCLHACPIKNTLKINKKEMKWMPATVTVVLIVVALFLAKTIELPTINLKWAPDEKFKQAAVFSQSGIKNIKCYGSSMSFASRMKQVKGVLGVETYIRSHTARIYYDSTQVTPEKIRRAIFTPTQTMVARLPAHLDSLSAVTMGIDKLFDTYDQFYLTRLLAQTKGVYGFSTHFGEPVRTTIFYDPKAVTPEKIKEMIEQPRLVYVSRGKEITVDLHFKVAFIEPQIKRLAASEFRSNMFKPVDLKFNEYEKYDKDQLAVFEISFPQAANPRWRRSITMLISHVSTDDYVVRFRTLLKKGKPLAQIFYVKGKTSADKIYEALNKEMLTVHYRNGKTGQVKNPFKFPESWHVLSVMDLK